jgi:hypothetical protein
MSWDVGPQAGWLVGSTSRNSGTGPGGYDLESSSHGYVLNAKNIRWPINARKYQEPDGSTNPAIEPWSPTSTSSYVPWTEESLGSNHPGGTHVGLSDGSARFLGDDVDVVRILRPMASRYSGDIVDGLN